MIDGTHYDPNCDCKNCRSVIKNKIMKTHKEELYMKGMKDMLKWVKELPIRGSAGRMLSLHLMAIDLWIEEYDKQKKL